MQITTILISRYLVFIKYEKVACQGWVDESNRGDKDGRLKILTPDPSQLSILIRGPAFQEY